MSASISLIPQVSSHDHAEGRADAPLTLVEYGDYQCPYCGAVYPVVKSLQKALGKKLRFVFRNFPLTQAHPYALVAAEAAEAAGLQGKFWEMHDLIYENQADLGPEALPAWAETLELGLEEFAIAIKKGEITKRIKEDRMSGIRSGVNGTPCFFINGARVRRQSGLRITTRRPGRTTQHQSSMKTTTGKAKTSNHNSNSGFKYRPDRARPKIHQRDAEIQAFGTIAKLPNGLGEKVCQASVERLNQILADTLSLRDLYKKHHWQVSGKTFYQLHLLFDKHFEEQAELVDQIAERIQALGGLSYAMAADVAENTNVPRPPKGREEVPVQISRLLTAHEIILQGARASARKAAEMGDDGTNDLLVSDVIRTNEMQVWFLAEHVV